MKFYMNTAEIKEAIRSYYKNRFAYTGLFEFKPDFWVCFDAFMVLPHGRAFRGFEFKASRSDFLADKKWKNYLPFCHLFYFVCGEGLIRPEEIESPAGLIWVKKRDTFTWLEIKKRAKKQALNIPLKQEREILFLFASRAKTKSGDFF